MNKAREKFEKLQDILKKMKTVVVAFSGGVDSSFLLKTALDVLGRDNVLAVTALSETYPESERESAEKLAHYLKVEHVLIYTKEIEDENFRKNPLNRCYYCKKELFTKLKTIADEYGFKHIIEGSNYDDIEDFRPGKKAISELGIRSPLQEAKLTKEEIRTLSYELGLNTWNKPAYACLSSRIPYNTEITISKLRKIEKGEDILKRLGFKQVRLRHHEDIARIEVGKEELNLILEAGIREEIIKKLKLLGYRYITFDLEGYRTGSMNKEIL